MLARLRLLTAGESHGPALVGILEGMPAGVPLDRASLRANMARRRHTAGRSPRRQIEGDEVEVLAAWPEDVDAGAEMRPDALLEKFGGDSLEQLRRHMAESAAHVDERA